MTVGEKLSLARESVGLFPLAVVLGALELPRSTWYYHSPPKQSYSERHEELRPLLEEIAREHPEYGYRRTTTELREGYDRVVNQKVVRRLHQLWGLPLLRATRPPRPSGVRKIILEVGNRANLVAGLKEIGPFEVVYTDFTELVYANGRYKAYLIAFPDHASKLVLGWAIGERAVTELAIEGWRHTVARLATLNVKPDQAIVHQDRDPVFTSYAWTGTLLLKDKAKLSYALGGAQDNAAMESFFGRFKTENRSLILDAESLEDLRRVVDDRMRYYNDERRHSSIGNLSPRAHLEGLGWRADAFRD